MTDFLSRTRERAARRRVRLAFPEATDDRVLTAAAALRREGIADPVLIGHGLAGEAIEEIRASGIEVVDPRVDERRLEVARALLAARAHRGLQPREAAELSAQPLFFAAGLVRRGDVAGSVAGCLYTTADVIRAALWLVGLAPDVQTLSSSFYMVTRGFRGPETEVLTFSDCAVVPYPTATQLADIAVAAARDRRRIVGDEPIVAMLSFSSLGSADGESVARVREACALARARMPDVRIDGELQADSALIPAVAARKAPQSAAAGSANVLIFPSLDAGNIAYKLVERLGGARAIGPILQGLVKPCSDLSRGASADDIINTAAVAALQAVDDERH